MEVILINKSSQVYYEFPSQKHGFWEVMVCLQGSGTLKVEGSNYSFNPGTVFCLPPNAQHSKMAPEGFKDGCLMIKDFVPPDGRKIPVYEDDSGKIRTLFDMAYEAKANDEPNASAIVNSLAEAIYQILVGQSSVLLRRNINVATFQNLLWENISNHSFDLAAEIDRTGYSKSYFRIVFKECTGHSPTNYLIHLRLEHAKSLLRKYHDVRTIKEIALDSGFTDPYYFSRIFSKYVGVCPKDYLKNLGDFDYRSIVAEEDPENLKFQSFEKFKAAFNF